jgi:DNA polymerase III gamma/tau subunit
MVSDHEMTVLTDLAQRLPLETIEIYYQMLLRGIELARRSSQPHFVLEMVLLRMANAPYALQMPELLKTVRKIAEKKAWNIPGIQISSEGQVSHSVVGTKAESITEEKKANRTIDSVPAEWAQFLAWLSSHDPVLHVQVSKSTVRVGNKPNELILSVIPIYGESLKKGLSHDRLVAALQNFFGLSLAALTIEEDAQLAKNNRQSHDQTDIKKAEREAMNHPVVREILELFNGSIVDVRLNAYSQSCDACDNGDSDYEM